MKGKVGKRAAVGYRMLIPSSLLILMISIYPLLSGFRLATMRYNILKPWKNEFLGLGNFIKLLTTDTEFYGVLGFSFLYTFSVVAISYCAGLCIAMLLNRDIKFRAVFRALALIPWVVPPVVAATNWLWVLNDQLGLINTTLIKLGVIDEPILFLASLKIVRFTVIFTGAWKALPFMMIVLLAGLQSIPKELYEAAEIDGSGPLSSFRYITLPGIQTVSLICTTLMFIWTFNNFENIYLLTYGGPGQATYVLPILSYYTAFFRSELGYASAIAVTMLFVLLLFALLYLRLQRRPETY
jgi:multiple sugar transport system permease protein